MQAVPPVDCPSRWHAWRELVFDPSASILHIGASKTPATSPCYPDDAAIVALFDRADVVVLVLDAAFEVIEANTAARLLIGRVVWRHRPLADLAPPAIAPALIRAATLALARDEIERLELHLGAGRQNRVEVTVYPFRSGICVACRARDERRAPTVSDPRGYRPNGPAAATAILHLDPRGYVLEASSGLEAITGLSAEACQDVRLPTLFDPATHAVVDLALDRIIASGGSSMIVARMLSRWKGAISVHVHLSADVLRKPGKVITATISLDPAE